MHTATRAYLHTIAYPTNTSTDTDKNYFDKDGESRELAPYAGLDGEGVEWGEVCG